MRKIATLAAVMALATVQLGSAASAAGAGAAPLAGVGQPGGASSSVSRAGPDRERIRRDSPEVITIALLGLTTFILGFIAAVKKRHHGSPASP